MLMHNEYGVAKETVSRMLGHTSVKTTEAWYCKTDMRKIYKDMAVVVADTKKPLVKQKAFKTLNINNQWINL
jgi:hypothetical protein